MQAVITNDTEDMDYMMRQLLEEYKKWVLAVNIEKTKYLCVRAETSQHTSTTTKKSKT